MQAPRLPRLGTEAAWTDAARDLARAGVPPEAVDWGLEGAPPPLFADPPPAPGERRLTVPRRFREVVSTLIPERSGRGMAIAYALLLRLQDRPGLLDDAADPLVDEARRIGKSVTRDRHKMKAFLRFREVAPRTARRAFAAWFEPDHRIEEGIAPFFARRFGDMDWIIRTPEVTIAFVDGVLDLRAEPNVRPETEDGMEELWTTYYASIFNPARLKVAAMRSEMPKKYWRNMPETKAIPGLIAGAEARVRAMQAAGPSLPHPRAAAAPRKPEPAPPLPGSLDEIARGEAGCTRCPLYKNATQAVPGEGPRGAKVMLVGEQPGDREDLEGRPFVGPAGRLLDEALGEAGLSRDELYVTNSVKHFKYMPRGKRRIHQRPDAGEVQQCRWWLEQERALIKPRLIVAMGATALQSLTGNGAGILKRRGQLEEDETGLPVLVTVHPSYLLRLRDAETKARETRAFAADLAGIPEILEGLPG